MSTDTKKAQVSETNETVATPVANTLALNFSDGTVLHNVSVPKFSQEAKETFVFESKDIGS